MSEAAILRRLKQVDQLRELCLSLMKAKKEHDKKIKNADLQAEKQDKKKHLRYKSFPASSAI